ncbi:MAG: porin [Variovorax sp.]|nr:MAG: porin [Variovorax sp.]
MKKSLVALAAMAVAGVASAQSSVTLFGVVDVAVSGYYNKSDNIFGGSTTASRTALTNSGYNSSRLGFRGTEDLGGGLAASFWIEGAINSDDGTGTSSATIGGTSVSTGGQNWQRRSTVSLSGGFGELRLGRDYTPTFWNDTVFDPFGTNGVGTNLISTANGFSSSGATTNGFTANPNYVRASNSIGYFLPPNLGGFYGQVMYAFSEKDKFDPGTATPAVLNNSRTGRYIGGRVGYANGPLDVAAAYGASTVADAFYAGLTTNLETFNLGASWDFGVVKLFGEYSKAKLNTDNSGILPIGFFNVEPDAQGWLLGATIPVGAGLIRMAYSAVEVDPNRNILTFDSGKPKADKFALGYVHNLSKRTALYATVARIDNKNGYDLVLGGPNYVATVPGIPGTATPKTSTGYDIGIRHAF